MSTLVHPRRRSSPVTPRDSSDALTPLKTNMTLRKGATFHSPSSSPASSPLDAFVPPPIRRSQTNLDDVVDAHRRRVALTLDDIDKSLANTTLSSPKKAAFRDTSLPIPRGLLSLPVVDPEMAKEEMEPRMLRSRVRRSGRHHDGDSGLGTSLESSKQDKQSTTTKKTKASAITRSAATPSAMLENLPGLGSRAVNRIHEHILRPLRAKPSLKDFEPIVVDIPRRIQEKEIICLRDLEKTLIFMAPERAKSAELYLDFCLTSVRCIQATVETLSDREQIRPTDRPYTNGYFIDLVEQIRQYAGQLAAAKEAGVDFDDMELDPTDEVKLYGGLHENGRPAELVRVRKDGTAISMRTGEAVDIDDDAKSPIRLKRSLSQQLEDEEEIMRSMARRKKNASPDEYAPKKCREPGCNKEFKRPCDLTKHEKTHSRPWKCDIPTCKYHEYGWPTEKERDRHYNDKHSSAPAMYECYYKPCPYKSKRESNCKQHMEKAHGWTYVRTKTNGRKGEGNTPSVQQQPTPFTAPLPTPPALGMTTPPEESSVRFPPNVMDFPAYISDDDFQRMVGQQPMEMDFSPLEPNTPETDHSYGPFSTYQEGPEFALNNEDLYNHNVHVPQPTSATFERVLADLQYQPATTMAAPAPHISPIGQANAMLYTPNSLADMDEGFDEFPSDCNTMAGDFQLFSGAGALAQPKSFEPLFGEIPSAGLGFSQPTSQDIFPTWFAGQTQFEQH